MRKRALIFDFVAIVVAAGVLYAGKSLLVPGWVLVLGAVVSVAALVLALKFSHMARKISREEYERYRKNAKQQQTIKEREKESD